MTPSGNNNNEFNARLFRDVDIGVVPSMEFRYSAKMKRYEICIEDIGGSSLQVCRMKTEATLCRQKFDGRDFLHKKVLCRPWKADSESEE